MENLGDMELRNVTNELTQGRELAKQLQIHLHAPSSSQEVRELLVNKIIDSYERVLCMVNYVDGPIREQEPIVLGGGAIVTYDSPPRSLSGSPRSQDSEMEFKDHDRKESSRKRKAMPRWTKQVQLDPSMGPEEPLRDGYSWRKYGQKEILGAKYPRGYYRCTYRHSQGCYATKQVQRSDDNPTTLEITYRGKHTCNQTTTTSTLKLPDQKQESNIGGSDGGDGGGGNNNPQQLMITQPENDQILFPHSFNFQSLSSTLISHDNFAFSPSMIDNYFLMSPSHVNNFQGHDNISVQTSGLEINDLASTSTSAVNSPTIGLDYPFSTMIFGPNLTFDHNHGL